MNVEPEWVSELQAILDSVAIDDYVGMMSAAERFLAIGRELGDDFPVVLGYLRPDQRERAMSLLEAVNVAATDTLRQMREKQAELTRRGE